jgi:hypothetical protein
MIPVFLQGYKVFDKLKEWSDQKPDQRRHWTIRKWRGDFYACEITWVFGDESPQIGGIQKVADTPEEAVWLTLEEFGKTGH